MSFSFPVNLSTEEIQQCLADLQIYIDVGQLTKPHYEAIRPYFEQAVIALTGVTRCVRARRAAGPLPPGLGGKRRGSSTSSGGAIAPPRLKLGRPCPCREELMQPKFAALDAFEFPELHDESIPTTNFFRHLTKLMLICGVKDFSLNASVRRR